VLFFAERGARDKAKGTAGTMRFAGRRTGLRAAMAVWAAYGTMVGAEGTETEMEMEMVGRRDGSKTIAAGGETGN
jgi:hypothetical protein